MPFELVSKYSGAGDQVQAIEKLTEGINDGLHAMTLLGATGTGKTFTIANVIKNTGKKTIVLAHNKTLAGQLYSNILFLIMITINQKLTLPARIYILKKIQVSMMILTKCVIVL